MIYYRPFNNPTETYRYFSLPYCHEHDDPKHNTEMAKTTRDLAQGEVRQGAVRHKQRLGESIVGDRRETSPYDIHYLEDVEIRTLCTRPYTPVEIKQFKDAILNNYFFEMFIEDLPMWGYVGDVENEDLVMGEVQGSHVYLFPHLQFHLGYNNNQIVSARITTDVCILIS